MAAALTATLLVISRRTAFREPLQHHQRIVRCRREPCLVGHAGLGASAELEAQLAQPCAIERRPDVARAQATRPIFAVSLTSVTSAFSSRSASFLNRTQALPMLAFGSRSTYRSAT